MAGLCDCLSYMRETGQRMGKFATICQWEMQVDSKLEVSLMGAHRQLSLRFRCVYVLGFCSFEKTYGSVSHLISLMNSSVLLLLVLGLEFSVLAFIFFI